VCIFCLLCGDLRIHDSMQPIPASVLPSAQKSVYRDGHCRNNKTDEEPGISFRIVGRVILLKNLRSNNIAQTIGKEIDSVHSDLFCMARNVGHRY
jgi:hypothetical protein